MILEATSLLAKLFEMTIRHRTLRGIGLRSSGTKKNERRHHEKNTRRHVLDEYANSIRVMNKEKNTGWYNLSWSHKRVFVWRFVWGFVPVFHDRRRIADVRGMNIRWLHAITSKGELLSFRKGKLFQWRLEDVRSMPNEKILPVTRMFLELAKKTEQIVPEPYQRSSLER